MKAIYLVAVHYGPDQYRQLLDVLSPALVATHVDRKSDDAPFRAAAAGRANVIFVSEEGRVRVTWGGWSQVKATLAMAELVEQHIEPDDYVILLSGDSYPLQSARQIESFLQNGHGRQYINSVAMPSVALSKPLSLVSCLYWEYDPKNGRTNLWRRALNRIGIQRRYLRALSGRKPFAGSTWWALTGQAVLWILGETRRDPAFVAFCKRSKMPDEFFFQTLLENSPFAGRISKSLMFADWSRSTGPKPAILDHDHLHLLKANRLRTDQHGYGESLALFARKVTNTALTERIRLELWPLEPDCLPSQAANFLCGPAATDAAGP